MTVVNPIYMSLTHEQYKNLEDQLMRFHAMETTHKTVEGGYHKSFRLQITETLIWEWHGPYIKPPLEEEGR